MLKLHRSIVDDRAARRGKSEHPWFAKKKTVGNTHLLVSQGTKTGKWHRDNTNHASRDER